MEKKKQVYSSLYSKMTLNMLLIKDFFIVRSMRLSVMALAWKNRSSHAGLFNTCYFKEEWLFRQVRISGPLEKISIFIPLAFRHGLSVAKMAVSFQINVLSASSIRRKSDVLLEDIFIVRLVSLPVGGQLGLYPVEWLLFFSCISGLFQYSKLMESKKKIDLRCSVPGWFTIGHLEKLPFGVSQARLPRPISASQKNEKCSHMTNMLRFIIFLFLGVYAYLTSNENSNFSRHPIDGV